MPLSRSCLRASLVAALTLAAVTPARAQSAGDKAAAEGLFQTARELMTQGKFADACAKLEASQRLDAGIGTLLYLADCYEKAGRLASAWATFREAESIASGRSDGARAAVAAGRATALEPRLSRLVVRVAAGNDPATEVRRDGQPVPRESWDVALPVDAGEHELRVTAPGRKELVQRVSVTGEGSTVPVDVPELEPLPEPPAAAAPVAPLPAPARAAPESDPGATLRTVGWIVGGVGVVGVAFGGLLGLKARSDNEKSLDHCPESPNRCDATGVSLREDAKRSADLATVALVAGGALATGGLVLVLVAPKGTSSGPSGGELRAGLVAAPGTSAFTLGGRF